MGFVMPMFNNMLDVYNWLEELRQKALNTPTIENIAFYLTELNGQKAKDDDIISFVERHNLNLI